MGDRFSIRMYIGGEFADGLLVELWEQLKSTDGVFDLTPMEFGKNCELEIPLDSMTPDHLLKFNTCIEIYENEGRYDQFTDLKVWCADHQVSFDYYCGADHQYLGDHDWYRPGMDGISHAPTDPDGDHVLRGSDVLAMLDTYYVTAEDLKNELRKQLGQVDTLPDLKILPNARKALESAAAAG